MGRSRGRGKGPDARRRPGRSPRPGRPVRSLAGICGGGALSLAMLVGCGAENFPDDTARVTLDRDTTVYDIIVCGLDNRIAYVVGETPEGALLQLVVEVETDMATGIAEHSGFTVTKSGRDAAAFGAQAWRDREETGLAPGRIDSARIRGARIQVSGDALELDEDEKPVAGPGFSFRVDARCDQD